MTTGVERGHGEHDPRSAEGVTTGSKEGRVEGRGSKGGRFETSGEEEVWFAVRGSRSSQDVPFEFVGKVACARAMAEASHVEGGTSAA